jgi:hypothetical protein
MKKLATLSAFIIGAALLSAGPFSLRLSPERIVSLSLDTAAAAKIGATGPRGPVSGAYSSPSYWSGAYPRYRPYKHY